jgi:Zn-dependent peptidase ImmA (M78 family)
MGLERVSKALSNIYQLVKACEDSGILVFRSSVVVNYTRRRLNVEEFRGFVIADPIAPAIFLNGDDSKYANIFTLVHELAHIWLGESGVSDNDIGSANKNEIRCNAIAAEVLVPSSEFNFEWDKLDIPLNQKLIELNRIFKVSTLVIARLALTNNKLSRSEYAEIHADVVQRAKDKKNKDAGKVIVPWGLTLPIKNSPKVTNTVIALVKSQKMMPREASILLNTSPTSIAAL